MSRAIVGLAAAFAVLALTGTASAASEVQQFKFSGPFAEVFSIELSAGSETLTFVNVASNPFTGATTLNIDQEVVQLAANGNITGFTDTSFGQTTSGFSFEKTGFSSASLTASEPATACSYDAFDNLIGCSPTTMNASLTWTGQGIVQVGVQNFHTNGFGFNEVDHFDGAVSIATATGTVGDLTLTASSVQSSSIGTTRDASHVVCIGNSC